MSAVARGSRRDSPTDRQATPPKLVEAIVAKVLRAGFVISAVVISVGLVLQEIEVRHVAPAGSRSVAGPGVYPKGLGSMFAGLGHHSGAALLEVGLWLLVATPAAAVVAAAITYRRRGDWRIAWLALAVITVLLASCVVGLFGP